MTLGCRVKDDSRRAAIALVHAGSLAVTSADDESQICPGMSVRSENRVGFVD